MSTVNEPIVEDAAVAWLAVAGWMVPRRAEAAPLEPVARRVGYGEVVPAQRLRRALLPKRLSGELSVRDARGAVHV